MERDVKREWTMNISTGPLKKERNNEYLVPCCLFFESCLYLTVTAGRDRCDVLYSRTSGWFAICHRAQQGGSEHFDIISVWSSHSGTNMEVLLPQTVTDVFTHVYCWSWFIFWHDVKSAFNISHFHSGQQDTKLAVVFAARSVDLDRRW